MNVRYELKAGVQLRPEDVTIITDDPQPGRTALTVMHPPKGRSTVAAQGKLDLKPPARAPWEDANPRIKTSIRFEMSEELHLKLTWIKDHVPQSAITAVIRRATEAEADRLIAEYFKP